MFLGHYALGFYMKKRNQDVPLWLIFLGVQFVDLLWALLLMFGIERASFNPEASVFLRAVYEYYPYSHSLFTGITIALIFSYIVYRLSNKKWAYVAAIAVLSHWFLDVIVHVPDVPLFFDAYKVGLGVWSFPVLTLILEVALLTVGFFLFLKSTPDKKLRRWTVGLYVCLTLFYIVSFFAPAIPPSVLQVGIFGVLVYGGVPLIAFFAERKRVES